MENHSHLITCNLTI